jgi:hypothetical protein
MLITGAKIGVAVLGIAAIATTSGCAACKARTRTTTVSSKACKYNCAKPTITAAKPAKPVAVTACADLPPNAVPGECYAKVFSPPKFETVTERVCVREASSRLEIIPAEYEWVEEQVLVKEASTQLVEVPAQYEWQERSVQTSPGHTTWKKEDNADCIGTNVQKARDVFCLVSAPPSTTTIRTEAVVKPATVEKVNIPAEYQTVRRQKVARPASTRTIEIPAEFKEVEKTVMIAAGHMEWQRIDCDVQAQSKFTPAPDIMRVRDTKKDD